MEESRRQNSKITVKSIMETIYWEQINIFIIQKVRKAVYSFLEV